MAVPRKKVTRSKRNMRRGHDAIGPSAYNECPNCGEFKLPHNVCDSCGHYKGRTVTEAKEPVA